MAFSKIIGTVSFFHFTFYSIPRIPPLLKIEFGVPLILLQRPDKGFHGLPAVLGL